MTTIKTVFHSYYFDVRTEAGKAGWLELKAKLEAMGLKVFESHGGNSHYKPNVAPAGGSREIDLETAHLFENQWNTGPIEGVTDKGLRVFDWALDFQSNIGAPQDIKRGHWLEQTAEMRELRRITCACGYCGKQEPAAKGYVFCPHCLDSAYLKESDLFLLRMLPINADRDTRKPLTKAEADHLLPLYHDAQVNGSTERGKARIAAARIKVDTDFDKAVANATEERAAALWIMDNVPGLLDNWLFYKHTGKHSFGWRKPLDATVTGALLEKISEFPFAYEITCSDGKTLSRTL